MSISDRIFELLRLQGKTQFDLASAVGVRQATVSSWKTRNSNPTTELLQPIAEFFGVSVDYIVTGKDCTPSLSQTINQGVIGNGNSNNAVTINGYSAEASEIVGELVRICDTLDIRHKTALLTYAYTLENEMSEVKTK